MVQKQLFRAFVNILFKPVEKSRAKRIWQTITGHSDAGGSPARFQSLSLI